MISTEIPNPLFGPRPFFFPIPDIGILKLVDTDYLFVWDAPPDNPLSWPNFYGYDPDTLTYALPPLPSYLTPLPSFSSPVREYCDHSALFPLSSLLI